ncbi:hypothetical protein ONS95_008258 [Cadophora gregata]|uniref:uncharacterized protein n=1 Tax=Cadophora gregata TaxID=51156 RepID=UPI0026DB3419|nr:uncharacterized protein ONS95_008258 [Cadophora gregata]KAK0100300.1 hypothetical protein ONS96_007581 [Cadophora gregata f. sp. sojae]KAK0126676.1 hypothetical protein ONS95_008258 [Cadophora gregata]
MSSIEGLQIAQIIADLQTLQNADPHAALSLLKPFNAPKTTASNNSPTTPLSRHNSSAPKFDKLGRRIVTVSRSQSQSFGNGGGVNTPTFAREGSSFSMSMGGSGASTPIGNPGSEAELDEDLTRAKTLLQLFEMRGKFKQMGDTGLSRAKQRVDNVVARYAKAELEEREKVAKARYLGV